MNAIYGFTDEHRFLSNFYLTVVQFDGAKFCSAENAYQAAKTNDLAQRQAFKFISPAQSKHLGRQIALRQDWDQVKLTVMLSILRSKFKHPKMRQLLLQTGDRYLEETNSWGDTFWGVYKGNGTNHLGLLLMQVRSEVQRLTKPE